MDVTLGVARGQRSNVQAFNIENDKQLTALFAITATQILTSRLHS